MTAAERMTRLTNLGYYLKRNYFCPIRQKKIPYARLPMTTGSVCIFNSLEQVDRNIRLIEQVREWQK